MVLQRASDSAAVRFLLVGGANTVLTWVVYWLALTMAHHQIAFALAFLAGVLFSVHAHARWSFGLRLGADGRVAYALYCVAFYFFGAGVLELGVHGLGVPVWLGNVLVTVVGLPVNFVCSRALMKHYQLRRP